MTFFFYINRQEIIQAAGSHYKNGRNLMCSCALIYNQKLGLLYLTFLNFPGKYLLLEKKGFIIIIMHKDSAAEDILQAYIHALVMAHLVDKKSSVHVESQSWVDKHYKVFCLKVPH